MQLWGKSGTNERKTKKISSSLSEQYKYDDYNIDESQNIKSNSKVDFDKIEDLTIG